MTFNYTFKVRGYELDSFGHVNHAVYLNYMEQARWEIVRELGLYEMFKESGGFLVVIEINSKFIREMKLFEKGTIETQLYREGFFLTFKHLVKNEKNEKVNKATIKCLFVDKLRNPLDIPEVVRGYLSE